MKASSNREARRKVTRMPQTIILVSAIVIGLLLLAIGGCYFAQGRERKQLGDRTGPNVTDTKRPYNESNR